MKTKFLKPNFFINKPARGKALSQAFCTEKVIPVPDPMVLGGFGGAGCP